MNQVFSFSECPIFCRNILLFTNDARISFTNKIEPRYVINSPYAQNTVASDGMSIDIDINFFPLFKDPLFESISNQQPIEIDFGGMKLKDGRISSFTLQGIHGSPIQGSARITFYQEFSDAFNPIQLQRTIYHEIENKDFKIAHATMTDLIQDLNIEIPMSFSYTYNARFNPVYYVGSEKYQDIKMDKRSIQMSLVGEKIDNYVSTFGNDASISFRLKDICGYSLNQRRTKFNDEIWNQEDTLYSCEGKITNFNSSVTPNGIIKGNIDIIQYI